MHDPAVPDRLVRGREIALLTNPTSGRGRGAMRGAGGHERRGRPRRPERNPQRPGVSNGHEIAWTRSMFVAPAVWLWPPSITMVSPA